MSAKKRLRGDAQLFELTAAEKRYRTPTLKYGGEGCYSGGQRALSVLTREEQKCRRNKTIIMNKTEEIESPQLDRFEYAPFNSTANDP